MWAVFSYWDRRRSSRVIQSIYYLSERVCGDSDNSPNENISLSNISNNQQQINNDEDLFNNLQSITHNRTPNVPPPPRERRPHALLSELFPPILSNNRSNQRNPSNPFLDIFRTISRHENESKHQYCNKKRKPTKYEYRNGKFTTNQHCVRRFRTIRSTKSWK